MKFWENSKNELVFTELLSFFQTFTHDTITLWKHRERFLFLTYNSPPSIKMVLAVACLYQEEGITGMFCHQTGGPITGWAYKREGLFSRGLEYVKILNNWAVGLLRSSSHVQLKK